MEDYNNKHIDLAQLKRMYVGLTARQREVLRLASQGLTNRQIGEVLCITPGSVAEHLSAVYGEIANLQVDQPDHSGKRYRLIWLFKDFFTWYDSLGE